jgi:predicted ATP-binding protein involved in virulence
MYFFRSEKRLKVTYLFDLNAKWLILPFNFKKNCPQMRITKLTAQNFRGFTDLQLDFAETNVTVFIGTNGCGKSSVLDLMAIHLNFFTRNLESIPNRAKFYKKGGSHGLQEKDIHKKAKETSSEIYLNITDLTDCQKNTYIHNVWCNKLELNNYLFNNKLLYDYAQIFRQSIQKDTSIPILVYYQANRNVEFDFAKSEHKWLFFNYLQLNTYYNAFQKNVTYFKSFFEWFKMEEDRENELIRHEKNFDARNRQLELVRTAIIHFFSDLSGDQYSDLRIQRGESVLNGGFIKNESASLLINKNKDILNFEQLSDGEKNIIVLVADIARRLAIANPTGDALKKGNGIVLIDEIDLHLHPLWQKEVLKALAKTFPNLQFIVTTHSPYVITHLDLADNQVQVLALTPNQVIPIRAKGKDISTTSFEIFGVERRPKIYQQLIDDLFKMFENDAPDLTVLETKLEALKQHLGASDPDVESAKIILEGLKF